jgi:hypothetical protein
MGNDVSWSVKLCGAEFAQKKICLAEEINKDEKEVSDYT